MSPVIRDMKQKETLSELTLENKGDDPECGIRNSSSKESMEIMLLSRKLCFPKFIVITIKELDMIEHLN